MHRLRRSHVSSLDGLSVPSIFESMRLSCDSVATGEQREHLSRELTKLMTESQKLPALQNRTEIETTWRALKPELRAVGIWRGFDSPHIRRRLTTFVKGSNASTF